LLQLLLKRLPLLPLLRVLREVPLLPLQGRPLVALDLPWVQWVVCLAVALRQAEQQGH